VTGRPDDERGIEAAASSRREGALHPRWALLSALACMVAVTAGAPLWDRLPCALLAPPSLCGAAAQSGVVRGGLVWLLFAAGWAAAAATLAHPLRERPARSGGLWAWLRALTDVETLRPILAIVGAGGAVLSLLDVALGRPRPVFDALALLPGLVAVWSLCYRPRPPARSRWPRRRALPSPRALAAARHAWPEAIGGMLRGRRQDHPIAPPGGHLVRWPEDPAATPPDETEEVR
jgi:hypothetical protein